MARVVVRHQAAAASTVTAALSAMLAEQGTPSPPGALRSPLAFTTSPETVDRHGRDGRPTAGSFDRLVTSLVADAARGAESVSIATRPRVGYVRYLSPPSCSRCAILAGRFYRWSTGFLRHPGLRLHSSSRPRTRDPSSSRTRTIWSTEGWSPASARPTNAHSPTAPT